jgi:hypothetical protein
MLNRLVQYATSGRAQGGSVVPRSNAATRGQSSSGESTVGARSENPSKPE